MNFPVKKSTISEFCEKKNIPDNMRSAFKAYARTVYADRFLLRGDTDTLTLMINRLTDDQLESLWRDFLSEIRKMLPKI